MIDNNYNDYDSGWDEDFDSIDVKNKTIEDIDYEEDLKKITIIGVGGGGCNAVEQLKKQAREFKKSNTRDSDNYHLASFTKLENITYYTVNTDAAALEQVKGYNGVTEAKLCDTDNRIIIGENFLKGKGAGNDINMGRRAAIDAIPEIQKAIAGSDLLFITTSLGGGTGTLASSVVAREAKRQGILTIAFALFPSESDGDGAKENADIGLQVLSQNTNGVIVIDNEKIISNFPNKTLKYGLEQADEVLVRSIFGVVNILANTGTMNIKFKDIVDTLQEPGKILIAEQKMEAEMFEELGKLKNQIYNENNKTIDSAEKEEAVIEALTQTMYDKVMKNDLLKFEKDIVDAQKVIMHVHAEHPAMTFDLTYRIMGKISEKLLTNNLMNKPIKFGYSENSTGEPKGCHLTIIATGINNSAEKKDD